MKLDEIDVPRRSSLTEALISTIILGLIVFGVVWGILYVISHLNWDVIWKS